MNKGVINFITGAILLLLIATVSLATGFRHDYVGSDTLAYIYYYDEVKSIYTNVNRELEPGFNLLVYIFTFQPYYEIFFVFIAFAQIYFLIGRFNGDLTGKLILMFLLLCYPLYYSISLNVIRSGLAIALLNCSLVIYSDKNRYKSIILQILGASIHYVTILFVIISYLARRLTLNALLIAWVFSALFAYLGLSDSLLESLNLYRYLSAYTLSFIEESNAEYITGFKVNYFLFSALPLLYIIWAYKKNVMQSLVINNLTNYDLIKLYVVFNAFAFIFVDINYADRLFIFSWMLIPYFGLGIINQMKFKIYITTALFFPGSVIMFLINLKMISL
jgi:hypothetical protein